VKNRHDNSIFQIRLRNLIAAMGVTDARFAELCGITPAALSQILAGKREPQLSTLDRIHGATGCSIDYLIGYKIGPEK
jgi:transcriptional regulator with XRE-family HTH domain